MRTATFFNFTNKEFIGWWDGKKKTIKAGQQILMPEFLARHFAKHLTNKVLIEKGEETSTSPKFPEQVPKFMDIFNKAFIPDETSDEEQTAEEMEIDILNRPTAVAKKEKTIVDNKPPQEIPGDTADDEENSEFPELNP